MVNGPETNSAAVVDQAAITTFPLGMVFLLLKFSCAMSEFSFD